MRKYQYAIAILVCLMFSCTSTKYTKRYKSIEVVNTSTPDEYIKIEGFSFDIDKVSTSKTVFDLSERGQKEIITQTANKSKDNKTLYAQLSKKFVELSKKSNEITNTKFKRRLVISTQNLKNNNGANRIESYVVNVNIPSSNKDKIKFAYWDKIVTEYQEVDLGKLTFSKTGSFSVSPDITMDGFLKGNVPINGSLNKTIGEEVNLRKKFASISGSISDSRLSLYRNSAPLEDVNGNILIELTIVVENSAEKIFYEFDKLFIDNKPNDISKIGIKKINYQFPILRPNESEVELSYTFKYREVEKGAETFTESDDKINLIIGESENDIKIKLLNEDDLIKNFWKIKIDRSYLTIISETSGEDEILFDSYAKAELFLKWVVMTKSMKVGGYDLGSGVKPLSPIDFSKMKIVIEK